MHHVMAVGMTVLTRSVVPVTSAGESKITRQSKLFFARFVFVRRSEGQA